MDFYLQQHSEIQEWHTNLSSWINCITGWTKKDGVIIISYQGEGAVEPPPFHRITTKDFDDWERQIYGYE